MNVRLGKLLEVEKMDEAAKTNMWLRCNEEGGYLDVALTGGCFERRLLCAI